MGLLSDNLMGSGYALAPGHFEVGLALSSTGSPFICHGGYSIGVVSVGRRPRHTVVPPSFTTGTSLATQLAWSPSGQYLAWVSQPCGEGQVNLHAVNVSSGEQVAIPIKPVESDLSWGGQDGRELLMQRGVDGFEVLRLSGGLGQVARVSLVRPTAECIMYDARFATGGRVTAVEQCLGSTHGGSGGQLVSMSATGAKGRTLVSTPFGRAVTDYSWEDGWLLYQLGPEAQGHVPPGAGASRQVYLRYGADVREVTVPWPISNPVW